MNDATRRRLTEYMNECWHTLDFFFDDGKVKCSCGELFRCPDEGTFHVEQANDRTFTTPDDMAALMAKIIEKGEWLKFTNFSHDKWYHDDTLECPDNASAESWYMQWLMNPPSFCEVAGEWVEKKGE